MPQESDTSGSRAISLPPLPPVGMPDTPQLAALPDIESLFVDEDEIHTFAKAEALHRELRIPPELALDFHEDLTEAKREYSNRDVPGAEATMAERGEEKDFNATAGLPPAPPLDPIQHFLARKKSEDLLALPTEQPGRSLPNPENEMLAYQIFPVVEGEPGQSDWKVGDPPPPLSSFLESNHFQSLSTEQRNLAFDRWSRYFNHWVTHHPGYTDSLRTDHTATIRQVHDWIDSEKTIGEYATGLGSSLWLTVKGIAGGLAMQLGETTTNFLDTNSSFDNIIGAKTTQVFDRWGRDITHRYDEALNRDDLRDYEKQGFTIQTIRSDAHPEYDPLTGDTTYRVDRREKLDEALSAFQHDLDAGNHPGGLAYTTWLGQWNKKIVDLATDYNREDRISLDRSLSDHESSRFFRKNETLAALLLDYRYTRRQGTFDEIVQILTETDKRKQTEEDIAVELEDPNGVVAFAKDHLSPENFQIVLDAGTDPVEIASNAASLVYGLGTAGKVAKATKRTIKQTTKAVGENAAGEALVEGTTEGFAAFVDDSRADIGNAVRDGAIMGILLQGVSATGGAAYSGARKGIQNFHELHTELKQLNEQLDSIGGNYDGMSEADFLKVEETHELIGQNNAVAKKSETMVQPIGIAESHAELDTPEYTDITIAKAIDAQPLEKSREDTKRRHQKSLEPRDSNSQIEPTEPNTLDGTKRPEESDDYSKFDPNEQFNPNRIFEDHAIPEQARPTNESEMITYLEDNRFFRIQSSTGAWYRAEDDSLIINPSPSNFFTDGANIFHRRLDASHNITESVTSDGDVDFSHPKFLDYISPEIASDPTLWASTTLERTSQPMRIACQACQPHRKMKSEKLLGG